MDDSETIEECIAKYRKEQIHLKAFMKSIHEFFIDHPQLSSPAQPVVHSIRARMKNEGHLREKLQRKRAGGNPLQPEELLTRVTDLAGLRILHLYQAQFGQIHGVIKAQLERGDWCLHEPEVAYTWDPESKAFFEGFGIQTKLKESFYTSIHYVLKPRPESVLCCELQVRTLFEEAWGEIDHAVNYPHQSPSSGCRDQLSVLSRLVGAATRLADSIFRAHDEG